MKQNVFTVDLGNMKLTDAQRKEISSAIQAATTNVLARTTIKSDLVYVPVNKWPKGPIIWGIVVRPMDDLQVSIENLDILGR